MSVYKRLPLSLFMVEYSLKDCSISLFIYHFYMAKTTQATTVADFNKFVTVTFTKKETTVLNTEQTNNFVAEIATKLQAQGIKFSWYSYLPSKTDLVTGEVSNEIHSFSVGYGFINISSNWTVYYKNSRPLTGYESKTLTIARKNDESVQFYDCITDVISVITKWQAQASTVVVDKSF